MSNKTIRVQNVRLQDKGAALNYQQMWFEMKRRLLYSVYRPESPGMKEYAKEQLVKMAQIEVQNEEESHAE